MKTKLTEWLVKPFINEVDTSIYAPPDNLGPSQDFAGYSVSYVKMEGFGL